MTAPFCLHLAHAIDGKFYRFDGLGAARLRRRFFTEIPGALSSKVSLIHPARPAKTRYPAVLLARCSSKTRRSHITSAPGPAKSP